MSFHASKSSTVTIDPIMAQSIISGFRYDRQRPLSPKRVKFLASEMERGRFVQGTPITLAVQSDINSAKFLVNGQHTLHAIVLSGKPQLITIIETGTGNDEDTASLYSKIDVQDRRTTSDSMRAYDMQERTGLTSTQVNKLHAATKLILAKFNNPKSHDTMFDPDDVKNKLLEFVDAANDYFEISYGLPTMNAGTDKNRSATLAVAIVTFKYSAKVYGKEQIDKFWTGALSDDGLKIGDPRKVAHMYARMILTDDGGGVSGGIKRKASAPYLARCLAKCFNKYIENCDLKVLRSVSGSEPIKILGSPFSG